MFVTITLLFMTLGGCVGQVDQADVSNAGGSGSADAGVAKVGKPVNAAATTDCKNFTNSTSSVLFNGSYPPAPTNSWGYNQQLNGHVNEARSVVMLYPGTFACVPDHEDVDQLTPLATVVFCTSSEAGQNIYVNNFAKVGTAPIDWQTQWTADAYITSATTPGTGTLFAHTTYRFSGQGHTVTFLGGQVWKNNPSAFGNDAQSCRQ